MEALLHDTFIPARAVQMGAREGNDGLFSLTAASGAQILWMGEASDPARYTIMSKVIRGECSYNQKVSLPVSLPKSDSLPSSSAPLPKSDLLPSSSAPPFARTSSSEFVI